MFCSGCGAHLDASSPAPAGADQRCLLYQSTGTSKSLSIILGVFAIIVIAIGLICFRWLPYIKKNETTYVIIMGIIVLSCGVALLSSSILLGVAFSRCWLKIYADHIESYAGLMNDYVHCALAQIQSVQMYRGGIVLTISGAKHKIMCREPQKVFDIINQCQMNALQTLP